MKKYVENPKPAFQLFREKDGVMTPTMTVGGSEIWCCGECGTLATSWNGQPNDAKDRAEKCCKQPYCECGQ